MRLIRSLLVILCCFFSLSICAHPHSFIEMKTKILGTQTQINGFHMQWTFDAITTTYMYDGLDMSSKNKHKTLARLTQSILTNMKKSHYFIYVYHQDKLMALNQVQSARLQNNQNHQAILTFDVMLAHPLAVTTQDMRFMVYDPTYYVDIFWNKKSDVSLAKPLMPFYKIKLVEPHPSLEQMNYATSLDVETHPDNTLGELFTQQIVLIAN